MKADSSGTITYFYDAEDILCEYDSSGNLQARYTHGPGIDEPISMSRGGSDSYYHADGLGSVVNLTDASGVSVASYAYEAFGKVRSQTGNIVNFFRFTGREWDEDSGLYYYRARYYDPQIGRFITQDPFEGNLNDPSSLHRYLYVNNNPINKTDPTGLHSFGECMNKCLGVAGEIFDWRVQGACITVCTACYVFHPSCLACALCTGIGGGSFMACVLHCATHDEHDDGCN
jgi:RHS repeat-associated protein